MFLICKTYSSFFQSSLNVDYYIDFAKKTSFDFISLTDFENIFDMWDFIIKAKENCIKPLVGVELYLKSFFPGLFVFIKDWKNINIFYEIISYKVLGYKEPLSFIFDRIKKDRDYFDGLAFVALTDSLYLHIYDCFDISDYIDLYFGVSENSIFKGEYFYFKDKYKKVVPIFFSFYNEEDFQTEKGLSFFEFLCYLDKVKNGFSYTKKLIENNFIDLKIRKPVLINKEKISLLLENVYREDSKKIFDDIFSFVSKFDILKDFKKENFHFINIFGSEENDFKFLKRILHEKLEDLSLKKDIDRKLYFERLNKELKIINEKKFSSYFLFVYFLTDYLKKINIPYIGRGSAASSLISYLLDITQVDPLKYGLYFERFLNSGRNEPPDIDLDFSWKDRDNVLKIIFDGEFLKDSFFKRFSPKARDICLNVVMISTRIRFGFKGAFHSFCKYIGIPEAYISVFSKYISSWDTPNDIKDKLKTIIYEKIENNKNSFYIKYLKLLQNYGVETIFKYIMKISGFPYGIGTHPGGICIAEKKITNFCPVYNGVKGFNITGFDMYSIENSGLIKIDILSQRALGVFSDCLNYLKEKDRSMYEKLLLPIDISKISEDKEVINSLQNGDTLGCFYIESPAMRILLKQLNCKNYLELVAASSVIRPGVSSSGMKDKYIFYKNNPQKVVYIIDELKDLLKETYGIMIYQEDVMKVAHFIGGLTLDKADLLRKGMSGKLRSKEVIRKLKKDFFSNAYKKGYSIKKINILWNQIESFAGYSFCKAHSASYAILSFKLLYLKNYKKDLFFAKIINNKGGYYPTSAYVYYAISNGIKFKKSDAKEFLLETEVKENNFVLLGIDLLSFLNRNDLLFFKNNRSFSSFFDFMEKVYSFERVKNEEYNIKESFNLKKLIKLALVGFFDPFYKSRFELFLDIFNFFNKDKGFAKNNSEIINFQKSDFDEQIKYFIINEKNDIKYIFDIEIVKDIFDYIYYGFFTNKTPFDFIEKLANFDFSKFIYFDRKLDKNIEKFKNDYKIYTKIKKENLIFLKNNLILKIGYLITGRAALTKQNKKMGFATFFDGKDFFEVVIFPDIYEKAIFLLKNHMFFLLFLKEDINYGVKTYTLKNIKIIFPFFPDIFGFLKKIQ